MTNQINYLRARRGILRSWILNNETADPFAVPLREGGRLEEIRVPWSALLDAGTANARLSDRLWELTDLRERRNSIRNEVENLELVRWERLHHQRTEYVGIVRQGRNTIRRYQERRGGHQGVASSLGQPSEEVIPTTPLEGGGLAAAGPTTRPRVPSPSRQRGRPRAAAETGSILAGTLMTPLGEPIGSVAVSVNPRTGAQTIHSEILPSVRIQGPARSEVMRSTTLNVLPTASDPKLSHGHPVATLSAQVPPLETPLPLFDRTRGHRHVEVHRQVEMRQRLANIAEEALSLVSQQQRPFTARAHEVQQRAESARELVDRRLVELSPRQGTSRRLLYRIGSWGRP